MITYLFFFCSKMNYIVYTKEDNGLDLFVDQINTIVNDSTKINYLSSLKMMIIYGISEETSEKIKALNDNLLVVPDFSLKMVI